MSKYFTRTFRVRWSAINAIGQAELPEYFRYVIETAWDWGATVGLSIAESSDLGIAWVIRESEIHLLRPLYPGDVFELTIWLVDWRRVRGTRCFELVLKDGGELVAQGAQEIVSLDLATMRPVATPDHIIEQLRIDNPRVIPHQKMPKLRLKREAAFVSQRTVEWRDLDSQEHVNNANFAAFAEDAGTLAMGSLGWPPSRFKTQGLAHMNQRVHIQYQSPALWGETLEVVTSLVELKPAGGVWHVAITRTADREPIVQCIIDWSLANRMGGEKRNLPDSLFDDLKLRLALDESSAS